MLIGDMQQRRRPFFARLLRLLAVLLLLVVLALIGGGVWLYHAAQISLPELDGKVTISGLAAPVKVVRDRHGVPHITAANLADLFFAQGYVTSQDRLWQMDMSRRSAAGELSEIQSGKFSTRRGTLLAELVPTPKLLAELRPLFPHAKLVGWKYEVDGNRETVITQGRKQIAQSRTNACVVNGPAYGQGFGVVSDGVRDCATKGDLFEELLSIFPKPAR